MTYKGIGRKGMAPFDLSIHEGEVVGVAGLLGSGRTEIARLMFGVDGADGGEVLDDGQPVTNRNPVQSVAAGSRLCPEDRKLDGIFGDLSVRENISIALEAKLGWFKALNREHQVELAGRNAEALDIRAANHDMHAKLLSGDIRQKVILARGLSRLAGHSGRTRCRAGLRVVERHPRHCVGDRADHRHPGPDGRAQPVTEGCIVTFPDPVLICIGTGFSLGFLMPIVIAFTLMILARLIFRRTALGLFRYWQNQRQVMAHQPEPFALAEFEIHRVVADASRKPFLRAASAMQEFGATLTVKARLLSDGLAPPEGLV